MFFKKWPDDEIHEVGFKISLTKSHSFSYFPQNDFQISKQTIFKQCGTKISINPYPIYDPTNKYFSQSGK